MIEKKANSQLNIKNGGYAFTLMIFIYVIIAFLGQAIISALATENSTTYLAVNSLFSITAIAIVLFAYLFLLKNSKMASLNIKGAKPVDFGLSITIAVGMFLGFGFVNTLIANLITDSELNAGGMTLPLNNFSDFLVFAIVLGVLPAVFEELFFRGLLLNCCKNCNIIVAVTVNAVCFALYHCSLTQFLYQLIYGASLCLLAVKSKSVLPCILAHFINNFSIILLQYLKIEINLLNIGIIVLGLLFITASIIFICSKINVKKETDQDSILYFLLPAGVFGIIVCVSLMVGALMV